MNWPLILVIVAIGLVLALWLSPRAVKETLGLVKAQGNKAGRWIGDQAPIDRLNYTIDKAREIVKNQQPVVTQANSIKSQLEAQIANQRTKKSRLEARINGKISKGVPDTDQELQSMVLELADLNRDIASNQAQLESTVTMLNNTLKDVKTASKQIADAEREAQQKEIKLDTSAARRQMMETLGATRANSGNLGAVMGDLSKYSQIADRQIAENEAAVAAAQQMAEAVGGITREEEENERSDEARGLLQTMRSQLGGASGGGAGIGTNTSAAVVGTR